MTGIENNLSTKKRLDFIEKKFKFEFTDYHFSKKYFRGHLFLEFIPETMNVDHWRGD